MFQFFENEAGIRNQLNFHHLTNCSVFKMSDKISVVSVFLKTNRSNIWIIIFYRNESLFEWSLIVWLLVGIENSLFTNKYCQMDRNGWKSWILTIPNRVAFSNCEYRINKTTLISMNLIKSLLTSKWQAWNESW